MEFNTSRHAHRREKHPPESSTADRKRQEAEGAVLDAYSRFLWAAVVKGNLAAVRGVYKERKVLYIDHHGNTALHLAAKTGKANILKWLIRYSGVRVTMRNSRSETCAHVAAKHGHVTCLRHILFGGPSRPLVLASDRESQGLTPLHLAVIVGNSSVVRWLVNTFGAPVASSRNSLGQTPLHFAAAKGCVKSTEALCQLGDEITNARDNAGCTPVYYAAQEGQVLTLRHLVDVAGAKVSIETKDGLTPLQAASQTGRVDIVHFLLQRGEDGADLSHQTKDGATVFHMAAANGQTDTLALLLRWKGAERALRMRDCKGSSPAHDAAENGHVECLKLLYTAGLDMHQPDKDGETPYSLASHSSQEDCVAYSKVLKHKPSDITLGCDSIESPDSEFNRELLKEEFSKEELLMMMDAELLKGKGTNIDQEKETPTLAKDKRGFFRKIKEKFEDEKILQESFERNLQAIKKEFLLRSLADRKAPVEKKTNVSYKQSNRPAAVNMPPGGQSILLQQIQDESDQLDSDSELVSPKSLAWDGFSLHKSNMVPTGTTKALRELAARIKLDAMVEDKQIESLLNISTILLNSDATKHSAQNTTMPSEMLAISGREVRSKNQSTGLHEIMTQTYADPGGIHEDTIERKMEAKDHLQSVSTQTLFDKTQLIEQPMSSARPILVYPVPPKRVLKRFKKLKHLSEYRPLKDKVLIEYESIPEADSPNPAADTNTDRASSEERYANEDEKNLNLDMEIGLMKRPVEPNHMKREQQIKSTIYSTETIRPPPSQKIQSGPKPGTIMPRSQTVPITERIPRSDLDQISQEMETVVQKSFASQGQGPRTRQIHPKIDILCTILSDSGIITPYEDNRRCQFPRTRRPETPDQDSNQENEVIDGIDLSINESFRSLPSPSPPSPPTVPPPPPPPSPPPPPPTLFSQNLPDKLQTTIDHFTSQRVTSDAKAKRAPSSGQTSGYISPHMRTPPTTASPPRDPSFMFHSLPVMALRERSASLKEQCGRDAEGACGKNNGYETTKEEKNWQPGSEPGNSPTQQINVRSEEKCVPWNVSLRRVPPRKEKANQMSELERYFKALQQRRIEAMNTRRGTPIPDITPN